MYVAHTAHFQTKASSAIDPIRDEARTRLSRSMAPPSPTRTERKEQLHARDNATPVVPKSEAQIRRSSMQTASTEPERKQSTTATYTQQYLQRRRSQQDVANDPQSPKANGNRRITRRRSSEDLNTSNERLHGLLQDKKLENGRKENGNQNVAVADTAVTKPLKASENGVGTGTLLNHSTGGAIERDSVSKATMTKKRKRPAVVMTLVTGVVTVVAGGLTIYLLNPSSEKVNELFFEIKKEMGAFVEVWIKWTLVQSSREMQNTVRAAQVLVEEFLAPSWVSKITVVPHLVGIRMDYKPGQLQSSGSTLVDSLKLLMERIQKRIELGLSKNELLEEARSFILTGLSSARELMKPALVQVVEWAGLKSSSSDVNLSSDHYLSPLVTHQAAIQDIGRALTAHESQALQDVKRLEKRRVTIASDTYSIIADTRNIALESIVDVKMATLEFIEMRLKRLEEQYARGFHEALKDYERTSRQLEKESGVEMLSEISAENQSPIDAAIYDSQAMDPTGSDNQDLPSTGEFLDERTTDEQIVQYAKEEGLLEEVIEFPAPSNQGSAEDTLDGNKDETQTVAELTKENAVEVTEMKKTTRSFSEEPTNSEHAANDQTEIGADLTEFAVEITPSSLKDPFDSGCVMDSQEQITAEITEKDLLTFELDSTDKKEVIGTVEEASVTEVKMDSGRGVLEMKHTDLKATEFLETQNQSEVEKVERHQEDRMEAHSRVPVDGIEGDFAVTLDNRAGENVEVVEQILLDVRTRIAVQVKNEEEDHVKAQTRETELLQEEKHSRMYQDNLLADELAIKVQSEQLDVEATVNVEKDVAEETVIAEVQREGKVELVRVHSKEEPALGKGVQGSDADSGNEGQQENAIAVEREEETKVVSTSETNTLESERVLAAKEIQELEQLEQVLLQEEGERVRIDEELRAIAEEEEIWLQSGQASAEGELYQDADQHITSTIAVMETSEVVVESTSDDRQSNADIPASGFSLAVGLLSLLFLVMAISTAYFLKRHGKLGLFARPPPRRRTRWRRRADSESDTEEVVLLQDDSSDEEDDTDLVASKDPQLELDEHTSSVEVNASALISSEGEEGVEEEKSHKDHEADEEEEKDVDESDFVTKRSRSAVAERVQTVTYTVDHPATPDSDASVEKSDTAITTPPASKEETPDTSQRILRPRRGIRT